MKTQGKNSKEHMPQQGKGMDEKNKKSQNDSKNAPSPKTGDTEKKSMDKSKEGQW
jgi:hypothetical protein